MVQKCNILVELHKIHINEPPGFHADLSLLSRPRLPGGHRTSGVGLGKGQEPPQSDFKHLKLAPDGLVRNKNSTETFLIYFLEFFSFIPCWFKKCANKFM